MADKASHLADFFAAQKHIPGPTSDVESPNAVHQADLLFLPHDKLSKALIPKVQTESAKKEHLILEPGLSMTCHCV